MFGHHDYALPLAYTLVEMHALAITLYHTQDSVRNQPVEHRHVFKSHNYALKHSQRHPAVVMYKAKDLHPI